MKKTVTVNISGIVYHIDVDAFEKLNDYLNKIRSYFKNAEECNEIMADIEGRIAELFNEKIKTENQVISLIQVEEMMEVMGRPEDFAGEENETQSESSYQYKEAYTRAKRRLFRDPDERVLGGVASGISAYLDLNPMWIRLLFVIIVLAGGSGILIYIVLWIVMPEAKTAAQKLQMRGEPVTVESIGKSFEEGAERMKKKINDFDSSDFGSRVEGFFESVFHVLGVLFRGLFKALGKIIGVAIVVFAILFAFPFFSGILSSDTVVYAFTDQGFFSIESTDLLMSIFNSESQYTWAKISFIFLVGIPIVALLYGGLRMLIGFKTNNGELLGLGFLWLISLSMAVYSAIQLGNNFKSESTVHEEIVLSDTTKMISLKLNLSEPPGEQMISANDDEFMLYMDESNVYYGCPTLDIKKSNNEELSLKLIKSSHGPTRRQATANAQEIAYSFEKNDEEILFDSFIGYEKEQKIRGQNMELVLYVPEGMIVYLDESMENMIYDIDNVTNTWDNDMLGLTWVMLDDGLTCLDCRDIEGVSSEELIDMLDTF